MKSSKSKIHAAIREADPNLDKNDESFKAAAVLLASANVGPNQRKIVKLLGYPSPLVAKFGHYLRKSGVWKGARIHAEWGDEKNGGVAFWCDVCVARGLMQRSN